MTYLEAIVALNSLPKIGPVRVQRLLDAFGGDPARILGAPVHQLQRVDGIGPETAGILHQWESHADPATELAEAARRGITVLTRADDAYPAPLRDSYDPPLILYVWGELKPQDRHAIGIVGCRRASHYGTQTTRKFSFQLAHAGFTIVSGLARGIDACAHEAAIAARGRTIAVIGSGLAKLYPPENFALAEKIADGHGAVVSEFPLHTAPDKQTFPMRNRIVAAWSRALLVTECPAWSGALITANLASEYGRPVFAVPGPIDKPGSAGCNQLIRDGATLVTDPTHLLDDLGELPFMPTSPANRLIEERAETANLPAADLSGATRSPAPAAMVAEAPQLAPEEATILHALGSDECAIDALVDATGLPPQTVSACLMKLEMRRLVRAFPGFRYARRDP